MPVVSPGPVSIKVFILLVSELRAAQVQPVMSKYTLIARYAVMSKVLLDQRKDGVLLLTLNRPDKKNALSIDVWQALYQAFRDAANDDAIKVVVINGAGGHFSSGLDLAEFSAADENHPFGKCAKAIVRFDKPLLAAASGVAIGAGATLLFHADMLYVGESLRMRLPFVNLGLVPEFASSYLLPAAIGSRQAAELFYTAEWINAEKALNTGIANGVFSDADLLDKTMEKAAAIARWPLNSLRESKRLLKLPHRSAIETALVAEAAALKRQAGSPENIEAVMAFMEKRKPDFNKP